MPWIGVIGGLRYKAVMERSSIAAAAELPSGSTARLGILHLAMAIVAISSTPILFRVSEVGPTATAFYRTCLAVPILIAWLAIERRRATDLSRIHWRRDGAILILGAITYAANIVNYAWAVHFTTVANASLLSNFSPIFVSLGGFLVFGERVSGRFVAAMLSAIAGLAILTSDKLTVSGPHLLGDLLGVVSSLFFAAYLIVIDRLRRRLGAAAVMLWTSGFSSLGLLAAAVLSGDALLPETIRGWGILVALAGVTFALGQGLLTIAMARVGATFSSVALLLLPVSAAGLSWMLLGEVVSGRQAIGGVVVLASILGARLASR